MATGSKDLDKFSKKLDLDKFFAKMATGSKGT
jgi:hypothetical protein